MSMDGRRVIQSVKYCLLKPSKDVVHCNNHKERMNEERDLIWSINQWTGFYMTGASIMKELSKTFRVFNSANVQSYLVSM